MFDGIFEFCQLYTSGSIGGAAMLNNKASDIVINWSGKETCYMLAKNILAIKSPFHLIGATSVYADSSRVVSILCR